MEYDNKENKSIIVNLCGVKYKATHSSSSSINNPFLLLLGQIKYFIKGFIKTILFYLRKILYPILDHVFSNYGELIEPIIACYIVFGLIFTLMICIADLFITEDTPHSEGHDPTLSKSSNILNHIKEYPILVLKAIIATIFGTYCLSQLCIIIAKISIWLYNTLSIIIRFIISKIMKYYSKIPDIEQIDSLDIV